MRRIIGLVLLLALAAGGCAVYAEPYPYYGPSVYVAPPPIYVQPYHYSRHHHYYRGR